MKSRQVASKPYSILYIIFFALILSCIMVTYHDLKGPDISHFQSITVQKGDTLWTLGQQYKGNMSTARFVSWVEQQNHLTNGNQIQVGQIIVLPVKNVTPLTKDKPITKLAE